MSQVFSHKSTLVGLHNVKPTWKYPTGVLLFKPHFRLDDSSQSQQFTPSPLDPRNEHHLDNPRQQQVNNTRRTTVNSQLLETKRSKTR